MAESTSELTATVIAGYEGRPQSRDALALARVLGSAWDAGVLAVWVPERDQPYSVRDRQLMRARLEASQLLRETAGELLTDFPEWDLTVEPASAPAQGLHDVAAEQQASALVVGSSHLGPVGRVVIGSTASRLLVQAPCPIAIAPRGWADSERSRPARLGVGLDGCADCEAALGQARALAQTLGVNLLALGVVENGSQGGGAGMKQVETQLELAAASGAERLLLEGHPAEALAAASDELDLLVVGCRDRAGLIGHPLRSVSRRLIRTSACPLLVVPSVL
jgi:nucleotide-binding universal stress UspA family protein